MARSFSSLLRERLNLTPLVVLVLVCSSQNGNMEYKRQVHHANNARLRSLATQMSYRLDEGHGTCVYRIGVEDDGCHSLLDYPAMAESARILECIARSLNAIVTERVMIQNEIQEDGTGIAEDNAKVIRVPEAPVFGEGDCVSEEQRTVRTDPGVLTRAELSIHRVETHLLDPSPKSLTELTRAMSIEDDTTTSTLPAARAAAGPESVGETMSARNLRIAVVGNVDAGKSTLIGTLTTSCLDDGRGKSRTSIMKHRHEIESGRTSTATTHLMGFRSTGEPIAGRDSVRANKRKSEDEVARESYKVITLMDLAGHEKYLKTTCVIMNCFYL
jgi:GTPase